MLMITIGPSVKLGGGVDLGAFAGIVITLIPIEDKNMVIDEYDVAYSLVFKFSVGVGASFGITACTISYYFSETAISLPLGKNTSISFNFGAQASAAVVTPLGVAAGVSVQIGATSFVCYTVAGIGASISASLNFNASISLNYTVRGVRADNDDIIVLHLAKQTSISSMNPMAIRSKKILKTEVKDK